MSERVAIAGGGGREHALAYLLSQSPEVETVFVSPGNAGTQQYGENLPISVNNQQDAREFAKKLDDVGATFAIPSTDAALACGTVDILRDEFDIPAFGPSKAAARLESSKAWAGQFMRKYGVPHGLIDGFGDSHDALRQLRANPTAYVVKDDGLAAGKGVEASMNIQKLQSKIMEISQKGNLITLQERLVGEELSVLAVCDGEHAVLLPSCRDYKRIDDAGEGPNTGGMGAWGPVEVGEPLMETIRQTIIKPTLDGMRAEGAPFKGVLYTGLMLTDEGPKVIEYNVRLGDPELQAQALLLDEDLLELMIGAVEGTLTDRTAASKPGVAVDVVLASGGYPGSYKTGEVVHGLDNLPDSVKVFHAGTKRENEKTLTAGGRVLNLVSKAETKELAGQQVYEVIGKQGVHFAGMHYRSNIAK